MSDAWPWWAIFPVLALLVLPGIVTAVIVAAKHRRRGADDLVMCECGQRYHPEWGEFCPDCTGAT